LDSLVKLLRLFFLETFAASLGQVATYPRLNFIFLLIRHYSPEAHRLHISHILLPKTSSRPTDGDSFATTLATRRTNSGIWDIRGKYRLLCHSAVLLSKCACIFGAMGTNSGKLPRPGMGL
jgi:hypothetical protein